MPRIVELVPYDPDWPQQFAMEADRLAPLFGDNLVGIEHIGSTAVPGLVAKPIIDLLVLVRDIDRVAAVVPVLVAHGLIYKGENGVPGRRYFRRGSDDHHTHHIHVFAAGHPATGRYLRFRDYLRAHPQKAQAYAAVKWRLAKTCRHDTVAYTNGKTVIVQQLEAEAAGWLLQLQNSDSAGQ